MKQNKIENIMKENNQVNDKYAAMVEDMKQLLGESVPYCGMKEDLNNALEARAMYMDDEWTKSNTDEYGYIEYQGSHYKDAQEAWESIWCEDGRIVIGPMPKPATDWLWDRMGRPVEMMEDVRCEEHGYFADCYVDDGNEAEPYDINAYLNGLACRMLSEELGCNVAYCGDRILVDYTQS